MQTYHYSIAKPSKRWDKFLLLAAASVLAVVAGIGFSTVNICHPSMPVRSAMVFINTSENSPKGIFLRVPDTGMKSGQYVVYNPSPSAREYAVKNGWIEEDGAFIHQVGAVSGETYTVSPQNMSFVINGTDVIGTVKDSMELKGVLKIPYGKNIIPKESFLPVWKSDTSFDGRYEGAVPQGDVLAHVIPIVQF